MRLEAPAAAAAAAAANGHLNVASDHHVLSKLQHFIVRLLLLREMLPSVAALTDEGFITSFLDRESLLYASCDTAS